MNGPIKMYRTRQIVRHDVPIELPSRMYKLKSVHSIVNGSHDHVSPPNKKMDIIDQNNQHIPGMAELEAKQEEILKELAELKQQILSIKSNLNLNQQLATTLSSTSCLNKVPITLPDIVANVSPGYPPYSLSILQKRLQDEVALKISCHLHSSVIALPESTKKLENTLVNFNSKAGLPEIHLRLIWKDINSHFEFLVSFLPLLGEVNLLRYLADAFPSTLSYTHDADSVTIDSVLDLSHQIVRARTKTEKTTLLQSLNKFLGKSQWLLGKNSAGIADIAAYSAIRQVSNSNELGVSLGKWFQRCESVF